MSRLTVTKNLEDLLPTLVNRLPKELIELTTSLLSQSRSKVATLKPLEEPARGYICAHIACERLKTRLDLPDIKGNTPLPAKKYRDLYAYIDGALAPSVTRKQQNEAVTPSTPVKGRNSQTAKSQSSKASRVVKDDAAKTTLPHRSPAKPQQRNNRPNGRSAPSPKNIEFITPQTSDTDFPTWVMASIRKICHIWNRPSAAPHIFTGVSSVARLLASQAVTKAPKNRRTAPTGLEKYPFRLIPALAFTIAIQVETLFKTVPTAEEYLEKRKRVYAVFKAQMPKEQEVINDSEDELATSPAKGDFLLSIDAYESQCTEYSKIDEEWEDMDWYINASEAAGTAKDLEEEARDNVDDMDVDSDASENSPADPGPRVEQDDDEIDGELSFNFQRKKRKSPDDGEDEDLFKLQVFSRHGGEMMIANSGWQSFDSQKKHKRWVDEQYRKIASKRAKHSTE